MHIIFESVLMLLPKITKNSQCSLKLKLNLNKKYVLSNSESVQCIFFIFDHVTFIHFQHLLLCTKFHENSMTFH